MIRRSLPVFILVLLVPLVSFGEGLSREQGDAIVSELRQIRQLLEKQQKPPAAPKPSQPEKIRLKLGKGFFLGAQDAPLVMVEYTDYQCPFCSRFHADTFPGLKKQYIDTGKLRFITRDFPLDFHKHAMEAAQATRCAGEQEKFWQMKDALMKNHAKLTPELIRSLGGEIGLDQGRFTACLESGRHLDEIQEGVNAAQQVGINGTPAFVVGKVTGEYLEGYLVVGAQPLAAFQALLNELAAGEPK